MLPSLVFGVVNHFILESPDNVMTLPEHPCRHRFDLSADLLAVTELIGVIVAAVAIWDDKEDNENWPCPARNLESFTSFCPILL